MMVSPGAAAAKPAGIVLGSPNPPTYTSVDPAIQIRARLGTNRAQEQSTLPSVLAVWLLTGTSP